MGSDGFKSIGSVIGLTKEELVLMQGV